MTMSSRIVRAVLPLCAITLLGAGCLGGSAKPAGLDGGVFRTRDNGTTWQQLPTLNLGTRIGSIADVGIVSMAIDPQDSQAVYVGTVENGLLFSLDGGASWSQAKGLTTGRISAIGVDPKDKCTIYAARGNQIHKTTNCSRDWNLVYVDSRADVSFSVLTVDWFNAKRLYTGTNLGDLFRSDDGGTSWARLSQPENVAISGIAIDPRDSRTVYVSTNGSGLLKSTDSGTTWDRIYKQFETFDYARRAKILVMDRNLANTLYTVSKYGILRSQDGGATWAALNLPTPPDTTDIRAMLVHPTNSNLIVYATNNNIVFSADGGKTWMPKKLPTARGVAAMLFDNASTTSLFLGAGVKK